MLQKTCPVPPHTLKCCFLTFSVSPLSIEKLVSLPMLRGRALQTRGGWVQSPTGYVLKTWCPPHPRRRWGLKSDVRLKFPLKLDVRLTHRYIRPFIFRLYIHSTCILWCPPAVGNKYYANIPEFILRLHSIPWCPPACGGKLILLQYPPLFCGYTLFCGVVCLMSLVHVVCILR